MITRGDVSTVLTPLDGRSLYQARACTGKFALDTTAWYATTTCARAIVNAGTSREAARSARQRWGSRATLATLPMTERPHPTTKGLPLGQQGATPLAGKEK
ncbi:hypothetical protein GCM10009863_43810 [Streptomyces axinellae]|uniref:Uncharacterized protein n=1 Tax=Streptomyces axinellae TaxID=552788 RepID=A0ABP6CRE6_9ACTN